MLRLVTGPSTEPITLAEAKAHLRLEETVDDAFVTALIIVARQHIEKVCWRGMLSQILELELPSFRGADRLELPRLYGPGGGDGVAGLAGYPNNLQAAFTGGTRYQPFIELDGGHLADTPVISITYIDALGASQTLSTSAYLVEGLLNDRRLARVWLNTNGGYSWPDTLDRFDAVKIRYTVGWATPAAMPGPLKQAILLLISQMYEYRTPEITGTIATTLEFTIDALTSSYRFLRL